ncbi:MAG: ATP-binding cassette domain-containing protein [Deltaproteobacteria bacterium]|jgi:ABC-2 type transport system ATP-binding protein|nr:ATP-binding cassette domain-containing protein [Deltaproteobacteria bacterium]
MILIDNLRKSYGHTLALDNLSLKVAPGELFAFLGPNGAGKSTTIRVLNGLSFMDSGEAYIAGVNIAQDPLKAKRLCGMVAQSANLDKELTVWENLDIHGRLYGLSRSERRASAEEFLAYVEMSDRADHFVKTLSGGLQRRLMIARALIHRPTLLFLDEPTVGLDAAIRRRVWSLVKKVNQKGVTIFLTTHYIEEAEFLADRVAFIHEGKLVREGTPRELMDSLGAWAVDWYEDGTSRADFFPDRESATASIQSGRGGGVLRRVNLEDAFLSLTGHKVLQ